ncbi:unnamed protein product, partial [marine sediment metagenome]
MTDGADTSTEVLPFDAPTGLTTDVVSPYQIDLNWFPPAETPEKAVSYKVYRDGIAVVFPIPTSYSDKELTPLTTYSYTVSAVNIYGGESSQSSPTSATTLPEGGGGTAFIPPTPPEVVLEKSLIINNGEVYTNSVKVISL